MEDSVFTKIIKGQIPCHKVYENDDVIAFLDINPLLEGHVLVVPKKQIDHFDDLDKHERDGLMDAVSLISKRLRAIFDTNRTAVLILGYDVPHAHVHLVPSNTSIDLYSALGDHDTSSEPDHEKLAVIAEKIRSNL